LSDALNFRLELFQVVPNQHIGSVGDGDGAKLENSQKNLLGLMTLHSTFA
jgi:hypothetical protein